MNSKTSPINSKLLGQVAVVTGGRRGIGRAIAATLSDARMTTAVLAHSASEIAETARRIEQAGGGTWRRREGFYQAQVAPGPSGLKIFNSSTLPGVDRNRRVGQRERSP